MQLVCQRNSLNRRDVTDQEIAELSEILTVQENKRRSPHCQSRVQMPRTRGEAWQSRMYLNAYVPPLTHSINASSHEKCFRLTRALRAHLPDGAKTLAMSSSSLLGQPQDGSLLAPSFGEHSISKQTLSGQTARNNLSTLLLEHHFTFGLKHAGT